MRLHNTLTGRVEELEPRQTGQVGMYVCGPTVQDAPHFGHARAVLTPDVLRRYLEWRGYEIFHVRNITDVDDKIIARAQTEERPAAAVAEEFSRVWEHQIDRLGVLAPHIRPRATGHISEMVELIERLIAIGSAYEAGGDVFFSVRSFDGYGKLSGAKLDELRAGARVEPDERKEDPADFVLWKAVKPGEPSWRSPWGRGRPGWHIECSAMAGAYLGTAFDIHAGGSDLIFPHHENEVAQSEAATGEPFAHYWVHNGLLSSGEEKMSKSVGNIISLAEAIDRYGAQALRHFYLSAHYRSTVDFIEERLTEAAAAVGRWQAFLRASDRVATEPDPGLLGDARARFTAAMDDDLNTPEAHAVLFELVADGNQALSAGQYERVGAARAGLVELAGVLGYSLTDDETAGARVAPLVEELVALRDEARAGKDFATADRIRGRLGEAGVALEDGPEGTRWHLG
jgi:cysteinyl-tRNA synthetase